MKFTLVVEDTLGDETNISFAFDPPIKTPEEVPRQMHGAWAIAWVVMEAIRELQSRQTNPEGEDE